MSTMKYPKQSSLSPKVEIRSSPLQGRGMFAKERIKAAETVVIWGGDYVSKEEAMEAKIKKKVHPHMLRHSFATHLLEQGYAVTDVQPLLGHSRLETTLVYTHLAAPKLLTIQSPYDALTASKTL